MTGTQHPARTAVVLSAPQGWGKTRYAEQHRIEYGCAAVVDDWQPRQSLRAKTLHLTNASPGELEHLRCKVIAKGWN